MGVRHIWRYKQVKVRRNCLRQHQAAVTWSVISGFNSFCLDPVPKIGRSLGNMIPHVVLKKFIKRPGDPTRQLLPIMSTKFCSGDGERRKDKGGCGGSRRKTKLCVTKLYVKDGVWQRKMVCVCVTKLCVKGSAWQSCVKNGVGQSGVWKMVWRKMVCDKVVCVKDGERWCVTKLCVKDDGWQSGVWQSGVWKMVCAKVVCERRWVTKWCVKEGVWKMVRWEMVCDKVVCEGWCGERWCENVWVKVVCDKVVCERWWVSKMVCDKVGCKRWCVKDGVWKMVCYKDGVSKMVGPSAPPEPAQCHKCHNCHAKRMWMSPSATPATQSAMASSTSQPSAISATPATQNEGGCRQVPRLPRETKVCRGVTGD